MVTIRSPRVLRFMAEPPLEDWVRLCQFLGEGRLPVIIYGEGSEVPVDELCASNLQHIFIVERLAFGVMRVVPDEPRVHELAVVKVESTPKRCITLLLHYAMVLHEGLA